MIAACFSLPATFSISPDIGLDPSWQLSLQLAILKHKVFGQEYMLTYGPLGYLIFHAALNKSALLLYDLFLLGSLLSIYRRVLPKRPRLLDAVLLIALAIAAKQTLAVTSVLFTILCYWLWRVWETGDAWAIAATLIAAVVLFFGKVNYGMIMVGLIPAYGIGLLLFHRQRRIQGLIMLLGYPVLVWLGSIVWHVDLPGYLRSGAELIAGYNEAMFNYEPRTPLALKLACWFFLGMAIVAALGWRRLPWRAQTMVLPLIGLAALLLFKNAFVRYDEEHTRPFFDALALLLAVWCVSWRGYAPIYGLLGACLVIPMVQLTLGMAKTGGPDLAGYVPVRYLEQAVSLPWHQDAAYLEQKLRERFPESVLPPNVRAALGQSSVEIMPWESSIAVENGLNYHPRPVPGSYSVYTPWLDRVNARFLDSTNAPDWIVYTYGQDPTVDNRPAAWDESFTKFPLMEHYAFDSEFMLPMRDDPPDAIKPGMVWLLKHTAHSRRLVPVATNEVSIGLGENLAIPATTNLVFLTLEVKRSSLGKLKAAAWAPTELEVTFSYEGGISETYRAVLPILKTAVLVNHQVESREEMGNWLKGACDQNLPVKSLAFHASGSWAFQPPFKGRLVEYRWTDQE